MVTTAAPVFVGVMAMLAGVASFDPFDPAGIVTSSTSPVATPRNVPMTTAASNVEPLPFVNVYDDPSDDATFVSTVNNRSSPVAELNDWRAVQPEHAQAVPRSSRHPTNATMTSPSAVFVGLLQEIPVVPTTAPVFVVELTRVIAIRGTPSG